MRAVAGRRCQLAPGLERDLERLQRSVNLGESSVAVQCVGGKERQTRAANNSSACLYTRMPVRCLISAKMPARRRLHVVTISLETFDKRQLCMRQRRATCAEVDGHSFAAVAVATNSTHHYGVCGVGGETGEIGLWSRYAHKAVGSGRRAFYAIFYMPEVGAAGLAPRHRRRASEDSFGFQARHLRSQASVSF